MVADRAPEEPAAVCVQPFRHFLTERRPAGVVYEVGEQHLAFFQRVVLLLREPKLTHGLTITAMPDED